MDLLHELLWAALKASAKQLATIGRVLLPASLGSFMVGPRAALPLMLVVIIVTKLIGESRGLGCSIRDFRTNFDPKGAPAVVMFLGCVGALADRIVVIATRRTVFGEKGVQQWS